VKWYSTGMYVWLSSASIGPMSRPESEYERVLRLLREAPGCRSVTEVTGTTVVFYRQVPPDVRSLKSRQRVLPPLPVGWTVKLDESA
jgi:hypothetical protein